MFNENKVCSDLTDEINLEGPFEGIQNLKWPIYTLFNPDNEEKLTTEQHLKPDVFPINECLTLQEMQEKLPFNFFCESEKWESPSVSSYEGDHSDEKFSLFLLPRLLSSKHQNYGDILEPLSAEVQICAKNETNQISRDKPRNIALIEIPQQKKQHVANQKELKDQSNLTGSLFSRRQRNNCPELLKAEIAQKNFQLISLFESQGNQAFRGGNLPRFFRRKLRKLKEDSHRPKNCQVADCPQCKQIYEMRTCEKGSLSALNKYLDGNRENQLTLKAGLGYRLASSLCQNGQVKHELRNMIFAKVFRLRLLNRQLRTRVQVKITQEKRNRKHKKISKKA